MLKWAFENDAMKKKRLSFCEDHTNIAKDLRTGCPSFRIDENVERIREIVWAYRQIAINVERRYQSYIVSKRTVERSLQHMGFVSHQPTRVFLLNTFHRVTHLAWAREHRDWSVEDWKQVSWSDEFRIRLLNAEGVLNICRHVHEAWILHARF
ncbi:transposable element Tcb2 transposase [Trichonephila clavipes]|nr:transposable element Tcb2 transposase [Trichonephila clavipes]